MEETKTRLEVRLIERESNDDRDAYWVVAKRAEARGRDRYLQVLVETPEGLAVTSDVMVGHYLILAARISPSDGWGDPVQHFDKTPEAQNEAFETIEQLLNEEEGYAFLTDAPAKTETETTPVNVPHGPKRIEISFSHNYSPTDVKRGVVVGLEKPSWSYANFKITVKLFLDVPKRLEAMRSTIHERGMSIHTVSRHPGGAFDPVIVERFGVSSSEQRRAWSILSDGFSKLRTSEIKVIEQWGGQTSAPEATSNAKCADSYGEGYSWVNRLPQAYQPYQAPPPPKAYFRVAGDEIGASLYREQQERKTNPPKDDTAPAPAVSHRLSLAEEPATCYCEEPSCDTCLLQQAELAILETPNTTLH